VGEQTTRDGMRDDLEHDQAVLLARRRTRQQLNAIAAQCPGHKITVETYPDRKDRYVAQAVIASAKPPHWPVVVSKRATSNGMRPWSQQRGTRRESWKVRISYVY
jgi:hypothetical protein